MLIGSTTWWAGWPVFDTQMLSEAREGWYQQKYLGQSVLRGILRDVGELSAQDYQQLLDLTVALLDCRDIRAAEQTLLEGLVQTLGGEVGMFHDDVHLKRSYGNTPAWTPLEAGASALEWLRHTSTEDHPIARHVAATTDLTPVTVSDLTDERAWHNSATGTALRCLLGATHQLCLPLGTDSAFPISRSGSDFTDRDRAFAHQAQPLLRRVHAHLRELHRLRAYVPTTAEPSAPERKAAELGVTLRELTVLTLLAEGRTAAAIAHQLAVSERTVNTHLQNLYRKLGTHDRLTTVLLARDLDLVVRESVRVI
jgi:DNA-binding CsgD family transcriptional regulator